MLEERRGNELEVVKKAISITDMFELHPQHLQEAQHSKFIPDMLVYSGSRLSSHPLYIRFTPHNMSAGNFPTSSSISIKQLIMGQLTLLG